MSTSILSRESFGSPAEPTLVTLCEQIADDQTLAPRRRHDVLSALRSLARALGKEPAAVPAHPAWLRARLKGFTPAMAGLSARRWANILSLSRFALKHVGLARVPGRRQRPLVPGWAELSRQLATRPVRFGLSRLIGYCSERGIAPEDVSDEVLARFLADLEEGGLIENPRRAHRMACLAWNEAASAVPAWPQRRLAVPDYRRTYALPWTAFPASLEADVDAYLDHLAGKDLLTERDFRPLRPASIACRSRQFHEFVSALVHRGRDPHSLRSLRDIVAVDAFKDGLRFFLDRADGQRTPHAAYIARAVTAAARHWVKVEPAHLAALQAICRRLDASTTGLAAQNRDRLRQFDDPERVRSLLLLPQRIVTEARRAESVTRAVALAVQTAVAVELLLMLPMRIKNLAALAIGTHLLRSRKGRYHLTIPGHEVKNGTDIEAVLPAETGRLLDLYRPVLCTATSNALFPGRNGTATKSCDALREQIQDCVRERCGLLVNPHLFRNIAAKLYLDANPGAYGVVRQLHGHKSVDTTTRFYCGMEAAAAVQHYDSHVLQLRGGVTAAASATAPPRRRGVAR